MRRILYCLAIIGFLVTACHNKVENEKFLKDHLPFKPGAAISYKWLTTSKEYQNVMVNNFSSVTFTNELKMKWIHPEENRWDFSIADSMIKFAQHNNLQVHGHTLAWHYSTPQWLAKYDGDSSKLEEIIKNHIFKVVPRYKKKVISWDVVNEAISDHPDEFYRNTIWYRNLGGDYIARVFHYAHEADPDALLFYNEYGTERDTAKFRKTLQLVNELLAKGVPIHGIGFQLHTQIGWPPVSLIDSLITEAVKTDLLIHFSEVDVSVNGLTTEIGYLKSFEEDM